MATPQNDPTGITTVGLNSVQQRAASSPARWNSADSGDVTIGMFGHMTDRNGNRVELTNDQKAEIMLTCDAPKLQMAKLEGVARDCGAVITAEVREFLERLLDPASFQQELINAGMKTAARKQRVSLKALTAAATGA